MGSIASHLFPSHLVSRWSTGHYLSFLFPSYFLPCTIDRHEHVMYIIPPILFELAGIIECHCLQRHITLDAK